MHKLTKEAGRGIVRQIVGCLPGAWSIDADTYSVVARGEEGEAICFDVIEHQGRLSISGSFGDCNAYLDYQAKRPKITVDAGRDPAIIAREIERKVLPDYRELLASARHHKALTEARQARIQATIEGVTAALGGTVTQVSHSPNNFCGMVGVSSKTERTHIYAEGNSEDDYGITLRLSGLTLEQVQAIAATL